MVTRDTGTGYHVDDPVTKTRLLEQKKDVLPWLRQHLTADRVGAYFSSLGPTRVERYEAPNLSALNFVLRDVLAGGASRSLRADTQGKTLALALLTTYWFEPPADVSEMLRPRAGGAP